MREKRDSAFWKMDKGRVHPHANAGQRAIMDQGTQRVSQKRFIKNGNLSLFFPLPLSWFRILGKNACTVPGEELAQTKEVYFACFICFFLSFFMIPEVH